MIDFLRRSGPPRPARSLLVRNGMATAPQAGDVIVAKVDPARAFDYDVSILGEPRQFSVRTYERALNRADSFARHTLVDVWYTEDGAHFRPITTRRHMRP